jgi:ABC-2 type transport system ATP-binding protein
VYEDLTVWEYLDYFARAYRLPEATVAARIDEVIALVGLEVKRDELARGLSRGMRQRLALARTLIHRPRVLLLDEPASGLDPKARADLRELLRELGAGGTTVLISSHILSELDGFCTAIGMMEQGRLVHGGTVDEITGAGTGPRAIRLGWTGDEGGRAAALVTGFRGASAFAARGAEATFRFTGTDAELAALLGELVGAGVRVVFFGEMREGIEDAYLRLSGHRVM